jgi:hypothetical protein
VRTKGKQFELDPVHSLFQVSYVAPDGQRFIFTTLPEGVSTPLVLVTNWNAELKK